MSSEDLPNSIGHLTSRQQRAIWRPLLNRKTGGRRLKRLSRGSLARSGLIKERKWELIFVTSRPETKGDTAQAQSYRWLMSKGYETPSVFVVHGSRGKIASALALDILVDDRPENCLDVALESKARAIPSCNGAGTKAKSRPRPGSSVSGRLLPSASVWKSSSHSTARKKKDSVCSTGSSGALA